LSPKIITEGGQLSPAVAHHTPGPAASDEVAHGPSNVFDRHLLIDSLLVQEVDAVSTRSPQLGLRPMRPSPIAETSNGKAGIEVRHLLSHTSGVSGWEPPFAHEDVYDWERSTSLLAGQTPWWEPGSASGYHSKNYGHLVGEVVRRITGTSIGGYFADKIAGPLGAHFHIGLPEKDFPRVSNVVFPGYPFPEDPLAEPLDPDSVPGKTAGPPFDEVAEAATDAWRRAEIPAANGHGNARSVARIQSIVSNAGEVDAVRLLSPRTIELILDQQSDGIDLAVGVPARFGIGYGLPHPVLVPYIPDGRCCFWFGWGGSIVVNDLDRWMTPPM
jgi:CubicO group peptidase (beta-lactamase class C family)